MGNSALARALDVKFCYSQLVDEQQPHIFFSIELKQPAELTDFLGIFSSVGSQFERYMRAEHPDLAADAQIYIKDIRQGSIEGELWPFAVASAAYLVTQADQIMIVEDFVKRWGGRIANYFVKGGRETVATKTDLRDFMDGVRAVARDTDGTLRLEAVAFEQGQKATKAAIKFNTRQARRGLEEIEAHSRELDRREGADYENVLMTFFQPNKSGADKSGEKAVIEKVSDRPLAVRYASDLAKDRIKDALLHNPYPFRLGFYVDVNVDHLRGRPAVYNIKHCHDVVELPDE